jgi:hypothetical protein
MTDTMIQRLFNKISAPKKYVSDFVKRQRAISTLNKPKLLWDSQTYGTYVRATHGMLSVGMDMQAIKRRK